MAIYYRTSGYVIKKTDLWEADQLFTIYTKDYGKISVLARSIRKIKSKLRSGIDIFYLSEIEFIKGKNYKTLTDTKIIDKNQDDFAVKMKIAEVLDQLIKAPEKDDKIFNLLADSFNNCTKSDLVQMVYHYFFWNLLNFLGYQINLYRCFDCNNKLFPQNLGFNSEGISCSACFNNSQDTAKISPEAIKILRLILEKRHNILSKLKINSQQLQEIEDLKTCFLSKIIVY